MPPIQISSKHVRILAGLSLLLLALTALVLWHESEGARPWKKFQRAFLALDREMSRAERAQVAQQPDSKEKTEQLALLDQRMQGLSCQPIAIRQLWLQDLGVSDRCITCHLGVESPRFQDARQPFTSHPGSHLAADRHPVDRFGCVSCHDGQDVALTVADAHGETALWLKPVLRGEMAEASCRRCHAYDDKVPAHVAFPEAPHLTRGKNLYLEKGCMGCHVLQGFERQQRIGPILDRVAEKAHPGWIAEWLLLPRDYLPRTIMPFFDLKPEQVARLNAYLAERQTQVKETAPPAGNGARGKELLHEVGCLACHAVGDQGGSFGPDLSRVAEKLAGPGWLSRWLDDPAAFDRETAMPDFRLRPEQIADLNAYLLTLRRQDSAVGRTDPALAEEGKALFTTLGCTGCHKIEGLPYGFPRSPEHTGFADKGMEMFDFGHVKDIPQTRAAWTAKKLAVPRAFSTETIQLEMPDFALSEDEICDLRVFLLSLGLHEAPAKYHKSLWRTADPLLVGMRTVEKFNCTGCHKFGLSSREIDLKELPENDYLWAAATVVLEDVVVDETTSWPKGTRLDETRTAALLAADPEAGRQLFFQRWFIDGDTAGYLLDAGIERLPVLGLGEGDIVGLYKDLNFAPPILHFEGRKVQPNWLYAFLDNPYAIRPLTRATMPTFNLSPDEISGLVAFFSAKEGLGANHYFAVDELNLQQTEKGEAVFRLCLQCHAFDQQRIEDKTGFEDLKGPNLAEVKRRLRPDYIREWVRFPDLIIPGTQMKNFFYDFDIDNRFEEISRDETGLTGIPPEEKIDLMARFLMNPFKNARLSIQR